MRCGNCGNELRGEARFCSTCGATVPAGVPSGTPNYPAPPQQPAATFGDAPRQPLSGMGGQAGKKSGCGKVLLILLGVGVVVAAGLGIAGYYAYRFAEGKLKSSEAYTLAVDKLKADPEVAERMGAIRETGFPLGNFEESAGGSGSAVYRMSVTGTKASGNYDVVMTRVGGNWLLRSGKVTLKGGEEIVIASESGGGDPAAEPPAEGNEPPLPPGPSAPGANSGRVVSGGVLNGKAISKPEPAYPAIARAVRASGTVVVQVTVDESGKVVSASSVSGHPLLRASAEAAARQTRFSPTLLSGKPVRVSGTITYNFVAPPQ